MVLPDASCRVGRTRSAVQLARERRVGPSWRDWTADFRALPRTFAEPPNRGMPVGSVVAVSILRRPLRLPMWGPYLVAAALAMAALLPMFERLPRVAVVACFDAGHPLYSLVPSAEPAGAVHCVTAPAPVVSWTLMVAATLVVQLILAPAALLAALLMLRGMRRLAGFGRQLLAVALAWFEGVVIAWPRPEPVPVPVFATRPGWARVNPRRGPPLS